MADIIEMPRRNGARDRSLPHNLDAEASVLGGLILRNDMLRRLDSLEVDDFYHPHHKAVFAAMRNIEARGEPIDLTTLGAELEKHDKLEPIGGYAFLGELASHVPVAERVVEYAAIVRRHKQARDVALSLSEVQHQIVSGSCDADEAVDLAQYRINEIKKRGVSRLRRAKRLRDFQRELIEIARLPPVATGIRELDESVKIRAGSLVVLVGGPGGGKTSLALQIARYHAIHTGPAALLSAELAGYHIAARAIAQHAGVSWSDALDCTVRDDIVAEALSPERLFVIADDSSDRPPTVAELDRELGALADEYPGQTLLAVVDYVQLLAITAHGREMRDRTTSTVEEIRSCAKRHKAAILALSQTSRGSGAMIKSGEMLGADALAAGAETAQLERAADIQLVLGAQQEQDDGTSKIDLSIAKVRAGKANRVLPMIYDGKAGRMWAEGGTVAPETIREQRAEAKESKHTHAAALAIESALQKSKNPLSRNELQTSLGIKRVYLLGAVKKLLEEGRAIEVAIKAKGGSRPLWTTDRAKVAGMPIAGQEGPLA